MQTKSDASQSPSPGHRALPALVVFALAFAVRLFFLVQVEAYPKFEYIRNRLDDQTVFDYWAKSIVRGETPDFSTTGHEFSHWRPTTIARQAPTSHLPQHYLSNVYYLEGDRLRALEHLEKAVELAPQDALLRQNLKALRRDVSTLPI